MDLKMYRNQMTGEVRFFAAESSPPSEFGGWPWLAAGFAKVQIYDVNGYAVSSS